MAFCYPGKGVSGDLPPPVICAQTWRDKILAQLKHVELTIIVGTYAAQWHLEKNNTITEMAKDWQPALAKNYIVLPHPSPRNNRWLKNNAWFENKTVPMLRQKVIEIINS